MVHRVEYWQLLIPSVVWVNDSKVHKKGSAKNRRGNPKSFRILLLQKRPSSLNGIIQANSYKSVMARNQKFEGKRGLTCYFCKKPGHKKSRCFEWRRAKGSNHDSQSDRNRSKFDSISSKAMSITINSTGLTNKNRLLKVDTEVRSLDSATKD